MKGGIAQRIQSRWHDSAADYITPEVRITRLYQYCGYIACLQDSRSITLAEWESLHSRAMDAIHKAESELSA